MTAARNMSWDEVALESASDLGMPLLRFYRWAEEAATFGRFQSRQLVERMTSRRPLVRRPTGGGLVLHQGDWTYSLVHGPGDPWYRLGARESYRRLHRWIGAALEGLGVHTVLAPGTREAGEGRCFVGAEQDDLVLGGRKIAGASQRRTRNGLLIQGSVQLPPGGPGREEWEEAMLAAAGVSWEKQVFAPEFLRKVEERRRNDP